MEWDPYRAEKNIEVGRYYFKKKNYDAAIERFLDAIRYRPEYALPHKLAAEAYEKKREYEKAIEYFQKYLEILPGADDADKIKKRIAELEKKRKPPRKST